MKKLPLTAPVDLRTCYRRTGAFESHEQGNQRGPETCILGIYGYGLYSKQLKHKYSKMTNVEPEFAGGTGYTGYTYLV